MSAIDQKRQNRDATLIGQHLPVVMVLFLLVAPSLFASAAQAQMARFGRSADAVVQGAEPETVDEVNFCNRKMDISGFRNLKEADKKIIDMQHRIVALVKQAGDRFKIDNPRRELVLLQIGDSQIDAFFSAAKRLAGESGKDQSLIMLGYCLQLRQKLKEDDLVVNGFIKKNAYRKHYASLFGKNLTQIGKRLKKDPRSFSDLKLFKGFSDRRIEAHKTLDATAGRLEGKKRDKIFRGSVVKGLPHVVSFGFGDHTSCTGTLIGSRAVLTAAHCFCSNNGGARFRANNVVVARKTGDPNAKRYAVSFGTLYEPKFCQLLRGKNSLPSQLKGRDMALVILKKDVEPTITTARIVNPVRQLLSLNRPKKLQVVGFGRDEFGRVGRKLRATIPVADYLCSNPETHDCKRGAEIVLRDEVGGRDTCNGDSGGPVFYGGASDKAFRVLVGVTSRGAGVGCGDGGIYTLVTPGVVNWLCRWDNAINLKMFGDNSPCIVE